MQRSWFKLKFFILLTMSDPFLSRVGDELEELSPDECPDEEVPSDPDSSESGAS